MLPPLAANAHLLDFTFRDFTCRKSHHPHVIVVQVAKLLTYMDMLDAAMGRVNHNISNHN